MPFPLVKKLRRVLGLPAVAPATVRRVGTDDELLYEAVRWNINQNDAALYNLLHCARLVSWAARHAERTLRGATVLEMGTSKRPGLPFVLLMQGCAKVIANNVFRVDPDLSESYAKLIGMLFAGFEEDVPQRMQQVIAWERSDRGTRRARLRDERFENCSPVPAEEIALPDESVDAAFSIAVLEHVKRPAAVLANGFRMLKSGGFCVHAIDLRDHRDFGDPLRFLRESDEAYERECPQGENRLRASEWLEHFAAAGYEIVGAEFGDQPISLDARGRTDTASAVLGASRQLDPADMLSKRAPRVSEAERARFAPRFRRRSLADLSQLSITVVARKPGSGHDGARLPGGPTV